MQFSNKNNFLFYVIVFFICCFLSLRYFFNMYDKQKGIVIILNGPSGAGKSSIQSEFQHLMMPDLWIKLGIDNLFDKPMPDITLDNLAFWQNKNMIRWVNATKDKNENNIITLFVGEKGEKVA